MKEGEDPTADHLPPRAGQLQGGNTGTTGPGRRVQGEMPLSCPHSAQKSCEACPVITAVVPVPESRGQVAAHVIILETRKTLPILLPVFFPSFPFILLYSLHPFFLSLHLSSEPDQVHIRMQRIHPQGHLLPWPGAALSLGSSLSCSVTSSKKKPRS